MSAEGAHLEVAGEDGPRPDASGASPEPEAAKEEPIQFEKAEFDEAPAAGPACAACKKPVESTYFQVGKSVVCPSCRDGVAHAIEVTKSKTRFFRALGYGLAASVLGSIVWYVIREITQLEIGLVAVGVGILVGVAVKRGSGGFGGRRYQVLAVALTYASITMTNVPLILKELGSHSSSAAVNGAPSAAPVSAPAVPAATSDPLQRPGVEQVSAQDRSPPGPLAFLVACVFIVGLAFALPFLAGVENILGIVIIGIGLYQAWKITRYIAPEIRGPFKVEGAGDPASSESA